MKELQNLVGLFEPDSSWLSEEKENYKKVFSNEELDDLPISFGVSSYAPMQNLNFNYKEQFEDKQKMAFEQIKSMIMAQKAKNSLLPTIRANLGTGFVPSLFGAEQEIYEDKMPWVRRRPSKEELKALEPSAFEDVSEIGLVPKAESIYLFYREALGSSEFCYLPDTQGVLDIAHLVRGDEFLYDVYDDPGFVHHLMELCLAAYINVSRHLKKVIGEPMDGGMHGGMALYNGGVRYCMDISVLFSRSQVEEFEVPYLRRALDAFGGGWVHFCGYAPHLVDLLAEVPEVRGINPNYMDSRPYDYERDMREILKAGKFFKGAPFKGKNEPLESYFIRVLEPLTSRRGLIFMPRGGGGAVQATEAQHVKELWMAAQQRMFN